MILQLVVKNCDSCIMENLSQTNYECLTMEKDEQLCMYFDNSLSKISEAKVTESFTDIKPWEFRNIKPWVDRPDLLKYTSADWRCDSLYRSKTTRQLLKEETFKFL